MSSDSRYIRTDDPKVFEVAGMQLPADWWSRPYEYAFALENAGLNETVADMGCGWTYRPLHDALAALHKKVYAVDIDPRVKFLPAAENLEFVVSSFAERIEEIPEASLDHIFCLSVLEDIQDPAPALAEFARLLKPGGVCVITFDAPFDNTKPCPRYPGLNTFRFFEAVKASGLEFVETCIAEMPSSQNVNHQEWNLCVFRAILKKP